MSNGHSQTSSEIRPLQQEQVFGAAPARTWFSPISGLASNQLQRRRSCTLGAAGLDRRDRTVAIPIAQSAASR
jgi:hypothetical protein